MRRYLIIIEKTKSGFGAYSPDLPGCVATGRTRAQTARRMKSAIAMHVEALRDDGEALPPAVTKGEYVEVAA